MNYFSFISNHYSTSNKLEKAISELLKQYNRIVISEKTVEIFKKAIIQGIDDLNLQHPRCKPIKPSWWKSAQDIDFHLSDLPGICNFYLYASK